MTQPTPTDTLQATEIAELNLDQIFSVSVYMGWDSPPWADLVHIGGSTSRWTLTKETAVLLTSYCKETPGNTTIYFNGWIWARDIQLDDTDKE